MTTSTQSPPQHEARPCFVGEPCHAGVPILRLDEAGEAVTVALICYQGSPATPQIKAAAVATAQLMARASELLELLQLSWGRDRLGITSGELIARVNRATAAAQSVPSPFAAPHARHLERVEARVRANAANPAADPLTEAQS